MKHFALLLLLFSSLAFGLQQPELVAWQEDLEAYSATLSKAHIDPFHSLSKEAFENELNAIRQQLPTLSENQIMVRLMALTHSINDGHTSFPLWGRKLHNFPIQLKIIGHNVYLVQTSHHYRHLLGAQITSIDGQAIAKVIRSLSDITPFSENPYSSSVRIAEYLSKAEVLEGLGLIKNITSASFEFNKNGKVATVQMSSHLDVALTAKLPLKLGALISPVEMLNNNLWYGPTHNKNTVYIKFRRYTSSKKMEGLAKDLLAYINKHQSKNLIVDLRDNYGGDFFVGLKLAQYLVLADSIDWKSGVYVLIDNTTFSAAMSNAAQFSQLLNATLVGEPTGAKPSGYQDMGQFTLPNSKLDVSYSKRLYHFKEDNKNALYPDVLIPLTIDDYINNRDKPLNWVLDKITKAGVD